MCVSLVSGLSKWVRQLVQHHDTFGRAMESLVAFSQGQQKMAVSPADSQTQSSTVSSPNGHMPVTAEGQGLRRTSEPQSPDSCVRTPERDSSPSIYRFFSHIQLKDEQNEKAGELTPLCCKVNI